MPNAIRFGRSAASYISRLTNVPAVGAFTMMGWVREIATGSSCIFRMGPNSASADFLMAYSNAGVLTSFSNGTDAPGSTLTAGRWYHVAFTGDGTTIRTYLNGVLDSSTGQSATATGVVMQIGDSLTNDPLNGNVAAIKVWNRVLAMEEINAELPFALPVNRAGLNTSTPLPNTWEAQDWSQGTFASDRALTINRWSDWSGNAYAWTETGTIDTEIGPPIRWAPPVPFRLAGYVPSVGGRTFFLMSGLDGLTSNGPKQFNPSLG